LSFVIHEFNAILTQDNETAHVRKFKEGMIAITLAILFSFVAGYFVHIAKIEISAAAAEYKKIFYSSKQIGGNPDNWAEIARLTFSIVLKWKESLAAILFDQARMNRIRGREE